MLRRLYDQTMGLAAHKRALPILFMVSFVESSIFPIPPDVMLIPMILAARDRAWVIAAVCTVASVLGGVAGYAIGVFLFEQVGRPMLEFYGYGEKFDAFRDQYQDWGAWAAFFAGVTPFPYKVITILSGALALSLPIFITASIAARGLRFFMIAGLLWKFGDRIKDFVEKRLGLLFAIFCVLLIGGVAVVKLVL